MHRGFLMTSEYEIRINKQIRAINLYAHWLGLTPNAACKRWCLNGNAKYWSEHN